MRPPCLCLLSALVASLVQPASAKVQCPDKGLNDQQFAALLQQVAEGWNTNDAAQAASAFHPEAVYSEPPDRQLYQSRDALYAFFGGEEGRSSWMRMTWHHVSFDEATQIGSGEFTFAWPGGKAHGMTSIRVRECLIGNWREYFRESDLEWDAFQGANRF